jgi:glutamine synthetase
MADHMQIYKYVVHNVAHSLRQDGDLHAEADLRRQRLGHARAPVDLEGRQAAVRRQRLCRPVGDCLYYIGGIIKHAKALNAFTNPTTNSYKRLVPGYEAPVLLAYSARNRSASCRIPYGTGRRRPSASKSASPIRANPYLAFAAMLMAGLDGIKNKIHPGRPAMDKNLYDLPPEELKDPDRLRLAARSAGAPRQGPRLPQGAACSTTTRSTPTSS